VSITENIYGNFAVIRSFMFRW